MDGSGKNQGDGTVRSFVRTIVSYEVRTVYKVKK